MDKKDIPAKALHIKEAAKLKKSSHYDLSFGAQYRNFDSELPQVTRQVQEYI